MSNSGLTSYQDECLELLAEECAEVLRAKSRIFRFGCFEDSYDKGITHAQVLEDELGDLLAIAELICECGIGVSASGLLAAKQKKEEEYRNWMINKQG